MSSVNGWVRVFVREVGSFVLPQFLENCRYMNKQEALDEIIKETATL